MVKLREKSDVEALAPGANQRTRPKKRELIEYLDDNLLTHPMRRLNRAAAAAFCGVSSDQMRRLERSGEIIAVHKTNRSTFYLLADLLRLNAGRTFGGDRDRAPDPLRLGHRIDP